MAQEPVPPALLALRVGTPVSQSTWGPDIDAALAGKMGVIAARHGVVERARAQALDQALHDLAAAIDAGGTGDRLDLAVTALLEAESGLIQADVAVVGTLGAALGPDRRAKRAAHGPVPMLLLVVSAHPLARQVDPAARVPEGVLRPGDLAHLAPARALSRRAWDEWRAVAAELVASLAALPAGDEAFASAYVDATRPALAALARARASSVRPLVELAATLPGDRRRALADGARLREALLVSQSELDATTVDAAPPPPP